MNVFQQFYALTKPRVVQLIVFCALIGMVLAIPGWPNSSQLGQIALACLGIWLVAGAAAAFNCLVEKGIDVSRITSKGLGEQEPINHCVDGVKCSEEAHQMNRRIEFIVGIY